MCTPATVRLAPVVLLRWARSWRNAFSTWRPRAPKASASKAFENLQHLRVAHVASVGEFTSGSRFHKRTVRAQHGHGGNTLADRVTHLPGELGVLVEACDVYL